MSIWRLRKWLLTRASGMLVLILLATSVGAAYACLPTLDLLGNQTEQEIAASPQPISSIGLERCEIHPPDGNGNLAKVSADDNRNLNLPAGSLPTDSYIDSKAGVNGTWMLAHQLRTAAPPVYLATERLRI